MHLFYMTISEGTFTCSDSFSYIHKSVLCCYEHNCHSQVESYDSSNTGFHKPENHILRLIIYCYLRSKNNKI